MPLIIEGGRVPPRWLVETYSRPASSSKSPLKTGRTETLRVAFINNMPDAALEDTEAQFFNLLDDASADAPIQLKLFSLPGVPRSDRGQSHVDKFYYPLNELWQDRFDGVIITGTEPRQPNLRDEPYWSALAELFDWAERNTSSAILSCLAAHAGVLHSDGIARHRLSDKQFGVFDFTKTASHALTSGTAERIRFPHSRWNELHAKELTACGYDVLSQAAEGGVDSFVKMKRKSLFVHFQGHPEYFADTLLKEYRRDIKRFTRKERETYPSMPRGYFDIASTKLVTNFRDDILSDRREELMDTFPETALAKTLRRTWEPSATAIYGNWLCYLASRRMSQRSSASKTSTVTARGKVQSKRIAVSENRKHRACRK
jgi:homoserine O-succinyltransferase/O-acetyltransferase